MDPSLCLRALYLLRCWTLTTTTRGRYQEPDFGDKLPLSNYCRPPALEGENLPWPGRLQFPGERVQTKDAGTVGVAWSVHSVAALRGVARARGPIPEEVEEDQRRALRDGQELERPI